MTNPNPMTALPSNPEWRAYASEILKRAREMEARNDAERAILLEQHGDAADDLPPIRGEGPVAYTSRRQQMMILCLAPRSAARPGCKASWSAARSSRSPVCPMIC